MPRTGIRGSRSSGAAAGAAVGKAVDGGKLLALFGVPMVVVGLTMPKSSVAAEAAKMR